MKRGLLARVDHWPKGVALGAGAAVGVGAGALAGWSGSLWAGAVGVGALGVAGWLARSGKAIAVERVVEKALPERVVVPRLSDALGMIDLPGGRFLMGSAEGAPIAYDSEKPQHEEFVQPFAIARFVVRQSLYQTVMRRSPLQPSEDDLPVNLVSWFDAVRFCNALSDLEGYEPAYYIQDREQPEVTWRKGTGGFRLPTEVEWEYAARVGTTGAYSFGDVEDDLDAHAWWYMNAGGKPRPVGTKKANPFGLFDVHGSVYEWCWDVYGAYGKPTPPVGERVIRGGSFWDSDLRDLRSAIRNGYLPESRAGNLGFRCARSVSRSLELR